MKFKKSNIIIISLLSIFLLPKDKSKANSWEIGPEYVICLSDNGALSDNLGLYFEYIKNNYLSIDTGIGQSIATAYPWFETNNRGIYFKLGIQIYPFGKKWNIGFNFAPSLYLYSPKHRIPYEESTLKEVNKIKKQERNTYYPWKTELKTPMLFWRQLNIFTGYKFDFGLNIGINILFWIENPSLNKKNNILFGFFLKYNFLKLL